MNRPPRFYCGIDWADHLNDVAIVDIRTGAITHLRIPATPDGVRSWKCRQSSLLLIHQMVIEEVSNYVCHPPTRLIKIGQ